MPRSSAPDSPGWPPAPADFQARHITADSVRLFLEVGGRGPNLVLLHGLGGSVRDFHLMAPHLSQRFRCHLVDLPGFGRSAKPDASYDMDYFINILQELWGQLDLGASHVAGHSMGGLLALLLAVRRPGLVSRVTAICPAGGHVKATLRQRCLLRLFTTARDRMRFMPDRLLAYGIRRMYADPRHATVAPLCRQVISDFRGPERQARARAFIRSARGILARPIYQELASLAAPIRLAIGARDPVVPAVDIRRIWQAIPRDLVGRPALLPSGHLPVYECPRETAEVIASN